jgi:ABC-type antimicrobial peptide transport system permease subunit
MKSFAVLSRGEKTLRHELAAADPEFLRIFNFPLVEGTPNRLNEDGLIYITEEVAIQFYGEEEAVGKFLDLIVPDGSRRLVEVAGVIHDHPLNASFTFDILMNLDSYESDFRMALDDWGELAHASFIELDPGASMESVANQINEYIEPLNQSREDWQALSFVLVPLNKLADRSRSIRDNYLQSSNPQGTVLIPVIMALVILLVGCINYMNATILISSRRLKEIAVRKALGGMRPQLIGQLIFESLLTLSLTLLLGVIFAELLLPFYNELGPWVELSTRDIGLDRFVLFLVALLLVVGLVSVGYPAIHISRFNTIQIFRSSVQEGTGGRFSRVLMILQLGFSLIAMIQGITYVQNAHYQREFDLGYNNEEVISIRLQEGVDYEKYRDRVLKINGFEFVGAAEHHMGYGNEESYVEINDKAAQVRQFNVGDTYLESIGVEIEKGRGFTQDSEIDKESMVLINENLADALKLNQPIDARLLIDEKPFYVAGVVSNFYPYGLWRDESDQLAIFRLSETYNYVAVRTSLDLVVADELLESEWQDMFPDIPYESEKENVQVFRSELLSDNMATINLFMAIVALFLSTVGLLTLISLHLRKRTKEIAIRRILGASSIQILAKVNYWFIWLILLAIALGSVLGGVLTEMFMGIMFSQYVHVGIGSIGITSLIVLVVVSLTSGVKAYKVSHTAPVESLQSE